MQKSNKPYFAKYLPVEGETEVGDDFLLIAPHPSGQLRRAYRKGRLPYWNGKNYDEKTDVFYIDPTPAHGSGFVYRHDQKKAKLFLCSRDVQFGDKVLDPFGKEFIITNQYWDTNMEGKLVTMVGNDKECTDIDNMLKILGEISPEATWVKEGDEFEEEEWQAWSVEPIQVQVRKDEMPYGFPYYIRIKGPCGHFH